MISNLFKQFLLISLFCSFFLTYCVPTRDEVVQEIKQIRISNPQFNYGIDPTVRYYLERVNEAQILDATVSKLQYLRKYITLCFTVPAVRKTMGEMVLLTRENAPKTYAFIEAISKKMGIKEVPLVYLIFDEDHLNAFAAGILRSLSIVSLGEKMMQEISDTETLEFLIAHELSHIKNYYSLTVGCASYIVTALIQKLFEYRRAQEAPGFYYIDLQNGRFNYDVNLIGPYINTVIKSLLIVGFVAWYQRRHEKNADMGAAHVVGACGGVKLCKMFKRVRDHKEEDYAILQTELAKTSLKNSRFFKARITIFKFFDAVTRFLGKPFRTHPEDDERIAYLEVLAKEQVQENSAGTADISVVVA